MGKIKAEDGGDEVSFLQLLRCVLRDLLEEKEVQKNLLQVHLNGTESSPNLMLLSHNLRNQAFGITDNRTRFRSPAD